jgi:hypothetical protein
MHRKSKVPAAKVVSKAFYGFQPANNDSILEDSVSRLDERAALLPVLVVNNERAG